MRRLHFETLQPVCPACRQAGRDTALALEDGAFWEGDDVRSGVLRCDAPECGKAYPIISGAPILVPDVAGWLAANIHLVLQGELETEGAESVVGGALGPDAAFNIVRQQQSTYGHDHYGDLFEADGAETAGSDAPGSVRRALRTALAHLPPGPGPILDIGCAAGRTTFDLAAATGALVLGIDLNWQLLTLGRTALDKEQVSYPFRRSGNRFERRSGTVTLPGASLADFWVADALAPPFRDGVFGHVVALNVLDCVLDPLRLIHEVNRLLRSGGGLALSTPFDWASHATPPSQWLEGPDAVRRLLVSAFPRDSAAQQGEPAVRGVEAPWSVRLHDNAVVHYTTHFFLISKC